MTQTVTVTGIVLATMPIGDYDKRVTILTKEHGKINAFARGARRPNSALLACCQPFTFGEFSVFPGRSSYSLQSANIKNYFSELRNDVKMVYYGLYFCEFTENITQEENEDIQTLKLLYQSLRALGNEAIGIELVRYVFELKALALAGFAPQVFECVQCGCKDALVGFHVSMGGCLCNSCKGLRKDMLRISPSTLYTMQYILASPVEKLYNFTVKPIVLQEFAKIMDCYRDTYMERPLKSLEFLSIL